jgi:hypothetical protein
MWQGTATTALTSAVVCAFSKTASIGKHFVAVHWLTEVEGAVVDPVTRLVPLTLSRPELTASYSVMPASAIVNGALIIQGGAKLWALQSPREQRAYIASNYDN